MSLDVYLYNESGDEVFSANITHNLGEMASAVGVYMCTWRPDESGYRTAGELIPILETGLRRLRVDRWKYIHYNDSDGWGTIDQFIPWLEEYLRACIEHPSATVQVSR